MRFTYEYIYVTLFQLKKIYTKSVNTNLLYVRKSEIKIKKYHYKTKIFLVRKKYKN